MEEKKNNFKSSFSGRRSPAARKKDAAKHKDDRETPTLGEAETVAAVRRSPVTSRFS